MFLRDTSVLGELKPAILFSFAKILEPIELLLAFGSKFLAEIAKSLFNTAWKLLLACIFAWNISYCFKYTIFLPFFKPVIKPVIPLVCCLPTLLTSALALKNFGLNESTVVFYY